MASRRTAAVLPSAKRLIGSLRDVGYSTPEAIADLVDNSVAADARRVEVSVRFEGETAHVRIVDDGAGMNGTQITEAMRYGAERAYEQDDLGKFGLGLKTASMSQCRRLSVASRTSQARARIEARQLDLDYVEQTDRWEVLVLGVDERPARLADPLREHTGTVVLWEQLDRILPYKDTSGGWAKNRLNALAEEVDIHLGMVFHRFLTGKVPGRRKLAITVNGTTVEPWDPFATSEPHTDTVTPETFEITAHNGSGLVRVEPYILPTQQRFSSDQAWKTASGPLSWNRQQGFYVYRANRLIQSGGWSRMRTLDEHNKLARVALSFTPDLDDVFGINVAKMRVTLPADLREQIDPLIRRTVSRAQAVYRDKDPDKPRRPTAPKPSAEPAPPTAPPPARGQAPTPGQPLAPSPVTPPNADPPSNGGPVSVAAVRRALENAAQSAGAARELEQIMRTLSQQHPEVARELGW